MCGRFSLAIDIEEFLESLGFGVIPQLKHPREYNIAPSQPVLALIADPMPRIDILQWGFIPTWAKPDLDIKPVINARGETISEKPFFRGAFKSARCAVIADGYYEWQKNANEKIPYRITMKDGEPFAIASLWSSPKMIDGSSAHTCALVTTDSNNYLQQIHNRMPVILSPEDINVWLDPKENENELKTIINVIQMNL